MTPLVYYDILLSVTDSVSEDSVIDVSVDTLVDFIEIPVSASGRARVYHVVVSVVSDTVSSEIEPVLSVSELLGTQVMISSDSLVIFISGTVVTVITVVVTAVSRFSESILSPRSTGGAVTAVSANILFPAIIEK